MENLETILSRWTDPEEIRLRAGEIDPDTMRDVLAITKAMARQIRHALNMKDLDEARRNGIGCPSCGTELCDVSIKLDDGYFCTCCDYTGHGV